MEHVALNMPDTRSVSMTIEFSSAQQPAVVLFHLSCLFMGIDKLLIHWKASKPGGKLPLID